MYYVTRRDQNYIVVRLHGPEVPEKDETLPPFILKYAFDDVKKWSDQALESERDRVSKGKDADEYALSAINMEIDRRKGRPNCPIFLDWNEMVEFLMNLDEYENKNEDKRDAQEYDDDEDDYIYEDMLVTPILHSADLNIEDWEVIRDLARVARDLEKFHKGRGTYEDLPNASIVEQLQYLSLLDEAAELRNRLLNSSFALQVDPRMGTIGEDAGWKRVYYLKTLASQMMFLYGEDRLIGDALGTKPNEDLFLAAMNVYRGAALEQIALESEPDIDGLLEELERKFGNKNENPDDYIFPQDMDLEKLAGLAEEFADHMTKADADDPIFRFLAESTEVFLKEKGFDLDTMQGLLEAHEWLEHAKVEEAFYTDDVPIDNALDWHMGEARLTAMTKIVKKWIKEKQKG